ncbi:MAG TPA: hypothetical protein VII50_05160 [Acidothermaceae bacterium]
MHRSSMAIATAVLGVAGLVACASARIATTNGSLASPTPSGTARGGAYSSPLPGPAFSAPPGQHLRVTVAQGCPATMPWAVTDVENPADPARTNALAPTGATSGLICRYATDNVLYFSPGANTEVDTPAPLPVPNLRASVVLTPAQAATLSAAAAVASVAPATGSYSCPSGDPGHVALIVLGYPDRADVDLWYSDTGCQDVDNGYASDFLLAGGDFGGAVDALVPRPSSGPATPSASTRATPSPSG